MKYKTNYIKVSSYEAKVGEVKKVLLLYSGGLDTAAPLARLIDCDNEACSSPFQGTMDTDVGTIDASNPHLAVYCVAADNCKLTLFEDNIDDVTFIDCSAEDCDTASRTQTAVVLDVNTTNSNVETSIYCLSDTDCKFVGHNAVQGDLVFVDCSNATCSTQDGTSAPDTDVGGTGVNVPSDIDCLSDGLDCKIVYADGSQTEVNFIDCGGATCAIAGNTLTQIDATAAGITTHDVSLDCVTASDCKGTFTGNTTGGSEQSYFFDCDSVACTSGSAYEITNTETRAAVSCAATANCKLVYYRNDTPTLRFADCTNENCLPDWVDEAADPWTGQTNLTSVSLSLDTVGNTLYAHVIKDTSEQAYNKSSDKTTISWGTEGSYGFTAGNLGHISASEKGTASTQIGVVLRQGTNFEFASVPEGILVLLLSLPIWPKFFGKLKGKVRHSPKPDGFG